MIAQSLAEGTAGAALLALERGENARPWLAEMVAEPIMAHPEESTLFEGAPAVAFTLTATSNTRALSTLDKHVESITRTRLDAAHRRIDRGALPAKREFDLIAGLTGLGAYLLHRHGEGALPRDVLAYLVRLTEPRRDGLPGWWALKGPTGPGPGWQTGHGNLGMAHGIAGPLALLSWCYGTPGIARAQQLAGLALGDARRQHLAKAALVWCVTDEDQLAQFGDVSLCHGWAGLLHTAWRASAHCDRIRAAVPRLLDGLADSLLHCFTSRRVNAACGSGKPARCWRSTPRPPTHHLPRSGTLVSCLTIERTRWTPTPPHLMPYATP